MFSSLILHRNFKNKSVKFDLYIKLKYIRNEFNDHEGLISVHYHWRTCINGKESFAKETYKNRIDNVKKIVNNSREIDDTIVQESVPLIKSWFRRIICKKYKHFLLKYLNKNQITINVQFQ